MNSDPQHTDDFAQAVEWIREAQRIVVYSGAGLSAASGISTFRDEAGFWKRFPPDQFANWKGLIQTALLQPSLMADFLIAILEPVSKAIPNAAHLAIAELNSDKNLSVVTQNIDRLHQEAGNETVCEVHGSLFEVINQPGGELRNELSRDDLNSIVAELHKAKDKVWSGPKLLKAIQPLFGASWQSFHRPNIVLFGDQLKEPDWTESQQVATDCDLLIAVGTSQSVYPAASLPLIAGENGANVIIIDPLVGGGDLWLAGRAEELLPLLVEEVTGRGGSQDA